MEYEVRLRLHEDDGTGYWGLAHSNSIGTFNAFWGADGIFHDVFEHYFEDTHKYFSGTAAFTLFGEMCASGHAIAYSNLGINNFMFRESSDRDYCADTTGLLEDFMYGHQDYVDFSIDRQDCKVPVQKDPDNRTLNYWLNQYEDALYDWKQEERNTNWKKLSMPLVRRSYIYGFKQASKIIGSDKDQAYDELLAFLHRWDEVTKANDAQHLGIAEEDAYPVWGFKFNINKLVRSLSSKSLLLMNYVTNILLIC